MCKNNTDAFEEILNDRPDDEQNSQDERSKALASEHQNQNPDDDTEEADSSEDDNKNSIADPEEPLISEDEDRKLQERHGISGGLAGFKPRLREIDRENIRKGLDTYDSFKRRQYSLKVSFYGDDKRRLYAKRLFRKDLDSAFGGVENLSKLTTEYDDMIENVNDPDKFELKSRLRQKAQNVPDKAIHAMADDLLDKNGISQEGYEYLIDNFIKN